MSDRPRCTATKKNGEPCASQALPGRDTCLFHDESRQEEAKAARRRGAKARNKPRAVLPADAPDVTLESHGDVMVLMARTINEMRKGLIDVKIATATGFLAGVFMKALEGGKLALLLALLQKRIARLEGKPAPEESLTLKEIEAQLEGFSSASEVPPWIKQHAAQMEAQGVSPSSPWMREPPEQPLPAGAVLPAPPEPPEPSVAASSVAPLFPNPAAQAEA
jgi:hypothetical protein